jgi:hypothetical protein
MLQPQEDRALTFKKHETEKRYRCVVRWIPEPGGLLRSAVAPLISVSELFTTSLRLARAGRFARS